MVSQAIQIGDKMFVVGNHYEPDNRKLNNKPFEVKGTNIVVYCKQTPED